MSINNVHIDVPAPCTWPVAILLWKGFGDTVRLEFIVAGDLPSGICDTICDDFCGLFIPLCFNLIWNFKSPDLAKALLHPGCVQGNGFTRLCVVTSWAIKSSFLNDLIQNKIIEIWEF